MNDVCTRRHSSLGREQTYLILPVGDLTSSVMTLHSDSYLERNLFLSEINSGCGHVSKKLT